MLYGWLMYSCKVFLIILKHCNVLILQTIAYLFMQSMYDDAFLILIKYCVK